MLLGGSGWLSALHLKCEKKRRKRTLSLYKCQQNSWLWVIHTSRGDKFIHCSFLSHLLSLGIYKVHYFLEWTWGIYYVKPCILYHLVHGIWTQTRGRNKKHAELTALKNSIFYICCVISKHLQVCVQYVVLSLSYLNHLI